MCADPRIPAGGNRQYETAFLASLGESIIGNMIPCGPRSRAFLAQAAEDSGKRRIAGVLAAARARRQSSASEIPPGPCSMSMTAKS